MYIAVQNELVAAYNFLRDRNPKGDLDEYTDIKNAYNVGDIEDAEFEANYKEKWKPYKICSR